MRRETYPTPAMVAEMEERAPLLRGRRTAQVPQLAQFRLYYRRRFYQLGNGFFALCLGHSLIIAANVVPLSVTAATVGLCAAFPMMFFCEFRARAMTRQLKRRAAEQLLRDMKGLRG